LDTDRWNRVKEIFSDALELPPNERLAFVGSAAQGDRAIIDEVVSLLDVDEEPVSFLEAHPALDDEGPDPLLGGMLGDYLLLEELSSGGMGTVYIGHGPKARWADQKKVAIKVLKRGMDTKEVVRRFHRERQILNRLDHPYITRLSDGGETPDGRPYLVMEFVEGQHITDFFHKHRLPLRNRLEIFIKVGEGVSHAHANLVVHRDLKPGNILVNAYGEPKLLDFGIAKLLDPGTGETRTGRDQRLLTPAYAAPEQLTGGTITTACDVYALGVLLYESLVGRLPDRSLQGSNTTGRVPERITPPSKALARLGWNQGVAPGQLRGDIDSIVLRAMREDPAERYHSVDEMMADLRSHLDGFPVRVRRKTLPYLLGKFFDRHRMGSLVFAFSVTLLVGTILVLSMKLIRTEERLAEMSRARDAYRVELERLAGINRFLEGMVRPDEPDRVDWMETRLAVLTGDSGFWEDEANEALVTTSIELLARRGRIEPAADLARRALCEMTARGDPRRRAVHEGLDLLARLEVLLGHIEDAEQLLKAPWEPGTAMDYEETAPVALTEAWLARNEPERARIWLERARADRQDSQAVIVLEAALLEAEGRIVEAVDLLRRHAREGGQPLVQIALARSVLAQARPEEAIVLAERALESAGTRFGCEHPVYARACLVLGAALLDRDDTESAHGFIDEGLAIIRHARAPDHPDTVPFLARRARLYLRTGRFEEARLDLARAEAVELASRGFIDPFITLTRARLALAEGRWQDVRRACGRVGGGAAHSLEAEILVLRSWLGEGRDARALRGLSDLFRGLEEHSTGDQLHAAELMMGLAEDLLASGFREEAKTYAERALGLRESFLADGHPRILDSMALLERL